MKIKIINAVYSKVISPSDVRLIKPALRYELEWAYKKPPFNEMIYGTKQEFFISNQMFYTGFIPRIRQYCSENNISLQIDKEHSFPTIKIGEPSIIGKQFRPEQLELIQNVLDKKRGLIVAPARTGKTVIAGGAISALDTKAVFLVHTRDLLDQTAGEFVSFGFNVSKVGKSKFDLSGNVVVATYQSFRKLIKNDNFSKMFGLVIVDECHHIKREQGSYYNILSKMLSPFRIGMTATPSTVEHDKLLAEGLMGPIIGEITTDEAQVLQIQAKPKLQIIKIPENVNLKNATSYQEAYRDGIIKGRARNRIIVRKAVELIEENNTILIIVTRIEHGVFLEELFRKLYPEYTVPFLCGSVDELTKKRILSITGSLSLARGRTKAKAYLARLEKELEEIQETQKRVRENSSKRDEYRILLGKREIKCVIATNIWNEGINIPSLNVVINAGGSKAETPTIQLSSRSLTACVGKEYGLIIDFFDPNHVNFISHFGERICTYMELGWI